MGIKRKRRRPGFKENEYGHQTKESNAVAEPRSLKERGLSYKKKELAATRPKMSLPTDHETRGNAGKIAL